MRRATAAVVLMLLLTACARERAPAAQASDRAEPGVPAGRLGRLLGDPGGEGFARALGPRELVFPPDHGPHPEFRHEWWYFTGHLQGRSGERFGFELTFFRFALAPPRPAGMAGALRPGAAPEVVESSWRARQIYSAHFAITDPGRREFRFTERYARGAVGLAGAQAQPLRVWVGDWSLEARADGSWCLHTRTPEDELTLELRALLPPVPNGERGFSRKSAEVGAASYYYSIPRLEARGQLLRRRAAARGGPEIERLELGGLAWLDREWGSGALGAAQAGWDWFALQLDDGSSLMFYALRRHDGRRDGFSAGTWVDPAGRSRALANEEVVIEVTDRWESPRGGRYPARWRLRVPALALELLLEPELADQELDTSPRYWEGAVSVAGTRRGMPTAGRGYVELVGYAR